MIETNNKVFAISDLHIVPQSDGSYDERWPKKNLPLNPNILYDSWVDSVAKEMDAYVYYIIDKNFTLGGVCDQSIKIIKNNINDNSDDINWFIIDLPGSKGKLNLFSLNPTDIVNIDKAVWMLHKGKDVSKVRESLDKINKATDNDHITVFQKLKKLENVINETANYNNRFIITEHCCKEMNRWIDDIYRRKQIKTTEIQNYIDAKNNPRYHDNRLKMTLLSGLDTSNEFIDILRTSIGEYVPKVRGRAKINSVFKKDNYLDKKFDAMKKNYIDYDNSLTLPNLNIDQHRLIGEKLIQHLTETTKLLTM